MTTELRAAPPGSVIASPSGLGSSRFEAGETCDLTRVANGADYIRNGYSRCPRRKPPRAPGLYPALVVLGIYDRCTPKLASDASRAVAMLSSLAEAQAQLRSDGIALDIKTLRSTAYRYAA